MPGTFYPRGYTPPQSGTTGGTTTGGTTNQGRTPSADFTPRRGFVGPRGAGPRYASRLNQIVTNLPKTTDVTKTGSGGGTDNNGTTDELPGEENKMAAPFWKRPAALYLLGALILIPFLFKKTK